MNELSCSCKGQIGKNGSRKATRKYNQHEVRAMVRKEEQVSRF